MGASKSNKTKKTGISNLQEEIIDALKSVFDPEIPVNIYELGLIYDIELKGNGAVLIRMTLTSPGCPVAASLPLEVESRVRDVPGIKSAKAEIVWDPPWNPDMISEVGKLQLGIY
jgi:FeS assembly SUF system protein